MPKGIHYLLHTTVKTITIKNHKIAKKKEVLNTQTLLCQSRKEPIIKKLEDIVGRLCFHHCLCID